MRAFSLLETVVALGLLVLLLPLVFDLIPGGLLAQRRGATMEAAGALAEQWIQEAKNSALPSPGVDRDQYVDLAGVRCHATREFVDVDLSRAPAGTAAMTDVVVTITPPRGEVMRMATRLPRS